MYIDNYEEALESIEEVKRSLLVAWVDRKVSKYFSERDSIVKKIEKDKYFVVFKHKYLEELIQDKFSILEEVKTIKVGNEMAVTLSIGVGVRSWWRPGRSEGWREDFLFWWKVQTGGKNDPC